MTDTLAMTLLLAVGTLTGWALNRRATRRKRRELERFWDGVERDRERSG